MDLSKIYLFFLTVLTNFSFEIFAEDKLFDYTSTTPESSSSITITDSDYFTVPTLGSSSSSLPPLSSHNYKSRNGGTTGNSDSYANATINKALLKSTQATWEPVPPPKSSFKFGGAGLLLNRRRRPKCCRRVRENERGEARKLLCKTGSVFFKDAKGVQRRRCRRRNRCKRRCKQHYKNKGWSVMSSVMQGLDYFVPKLEFKFHTGTLVLGTKFFSGLVPFLQAKIKTMHLFYTMFEPLLDGVLDVLDFGRSSFRDVTGSGKDDGDDDDDDDNGAVGNKKDEGGVGESNDKDAKKDEEEDDDDDDEDEDDDEDDDNEGDEKVDGDKNGGDDADEEYDDDIAPGLLLAKTDLQPLPEDGQEQEEDEVAVQKDEPIDEDYGMDEDWGDEEEDDDGDEDGEEEEEFVRYEDDADDDYKRIQLIKPPRRQRPQRRPLRPTRKSATGLPAGGGGAITPPTDVDRPAGNQQDVDDFVANIRDDDVNVTVYHGTMHGNLEGSSRLPGASNTHRNPVVSVDKLVLNINSNKQQPSLDDEDEYNDPDEDLDGDKLIETPAQPVKKVKSTPGIFTSFSAFFSHLASAFDNYFEGTY